MAVTCWTGAVLWRALAGAFWEGSEALGSPAKARELEAQRHREQRQRERTNSLNTFMPDPFSAGGAGQSYLITKFLYVLKT